MRKLAAAPAGVTCASLSVHAASREKPHRPRVRPEQLPIYPAALLPPERVQEQPGRLETGFAALRKAGSRCAGWCRGAYVFVKTGITDTVQLGKDAYVYLKNPPPDFLPKMGVITVLGLAGLISARKESKFKRIAYPLGLATLGATVCYPVQSVRVAKVTGKNTYAASQCIVGAVRSLWRKGNRRESMPERIDKTKLERSAEIERPAKAAHVLVLPDSAPAPELGCDAEAAAGAAQSPPDPKLTDHPQAHPEVVGAFCARS